MDWEEVKRQRSRHRKGLEGRGERGEWKNDTATLA